MSNYMLHGYHNTEVLGNDVCIPVLFLITPNKEIIIIKRDKLCLVWILLLL